MHLFDFIKDTYLFKLLLLVVLGLITGFTGTNAGCTTCFSGSTVRNSSQVNSGASPQIMSKESPLNYSTTQSKEMEDQDRILNEILKPY